MAASPKRSVSPWWGLLLLPVSLVLGWFIADLPSPPPRANAAATSAVPETNGSPAAAARPTPRLPWGSEGEKQQAESGDEDLRWMSLDEAAAESRRTGKPILLDFNAEWCGPCQALKRSVFEDPSYARSIGAQVIGVSVVDRNREDGSNPPETDQLQQRYQIEGFPTLIVLSPSTGRYEKQVGFAGADRTREWIARAARSVK